MTDLASSFPVSTMAISKHLKRMDEAGLVQKEKTGRVQRCSVDPAGLEPVQEWIEVHRRFWEGQLDALADYLADREDDPPPDTGEEG